MLAHTQELVYTLSELMPTHYEKQNLEAMFGLFLEAQGHPLPEHSKTKSASPGQPISQHSTLVNKGKYTDRSIMQLNMKLVKENVI
jgi:hypothetical protein